MIIGVWISVSIAVSFVAGWVVGKYGHMPAAEDAKSKLLAMHLANSNNAKFKS